MVLLIREFPDDIYIYIYIRIRPFEFVRHKNKDSAIQYEIRNGVAEQQNSKKSSQYGLTKMTYWTVKLQDVSIQCFDTLSQLLLMHKNLAHDLQHRTYLMSLFPLPHNP